MRELQEDEEEGEGKVTEQGLQGKKKSRVQRAGSSRKGNGPIGKEGMWLERNSASASVKKEAQRRGELDWMDDSLT